MSKQVSEVAGKTSSRNLEVLHTICHSPEVQGVAGLRGNPKEKLSARTGWAQTLPTSLLPPF